MTRLTYYTGDDVRIKYITTTNAGADFDLTGAEVEYRIAANPSGRAILTKDDEDGITIEGNTATVEFNADDLGVTGRLYGQLHVTIDGRGMIVAQTELNIIKRIQPQGS